jgi:hypothetical protein
MANNESDAWRDFTLVSKPPALVTCNGRYGKGARLDLYSPVSCTPAPASAALSGPSKPSLAYVSAVSLSSPCKNGLSIWVC